MREKLAEQDKILRKLTFQLAKVNLDSRMQQLGATSEAEKEIQAKLNAISDRSSMEGLFKFPSMVNESASKSGFLTNKFVKSPAKKK